MGGITYVDVIDYNDKLTETSTEGWENLLAGVNANAEYLRDNVSEPVGAVWSGTAAELAHKKFKTTQDGLIQTASNRKHIKGALEDFNTKMKSYQTDMVDLKRNIEDGNVPSVLGVERGKWTVSADGTVGKSPKWQEPANFTAKQFVDQENADEITRSDLQGLIQDILNKANSADDDTANELRQWLPEPASLAGAGDTVGTWTTVSDDGSLYQIAQKYYGDGNLWKKIWDDPANAKEFHNYGVTDPNLIYAGMKLNVPALNTAGKPHVIEQHHGGSAARRPSGSPSHGTDVGNDTHTGTDPNSRAPSKS
jgi:hypothetical protein